MTNFNNKFENYKYASRLRFIASYDEDDDYYSPTDWEQQPDESDTDYEERMEDQDSYLEYNS